MPREDKKSKKTTSDASLVSETYGSLLGSLLKTTAQEDRNELSRKPKRRKLNRNFKISDAEHETVPRENTESTAVVIDTDSNDDAFLNSKIEEAQRCELDCVNLSSEALGRVRTSQLRSSRLEKINCISSISDLKLQKGLQRALEGNKSTQSLSALQKNLAPSMFGHQDILFSPRSAANGSELRQLYCLHFLNHIFRTREQVLKNNSRDSKSDLQKSESRDQGYTRPKVLILLPNKNACFKVVEEMLSLARPDQQENKSRFEAQYKLQGEDRIDRTKPDDFKDLFCGNDDDRFRVGLKFTKNTLKFFSQFYNSDIIVGSPLGLRQAIESTEKKTKDSDFLSSIEIIILDWADALQLQNWAHVEFLFKHLNLVPANSHGCDFSRIRNWYLDGNAAYVRQTIILSQFVTPELNSLFYKTNTVFGKIKASPYYDGVLDTHLNQTFFRMTSENPSSDLETRFKSFMSIIIPTITRIKDSGGGLLILLPSYLEFFRVSNALQKMDIDFVSLNEYSSVPEASRSRSHFATGNANVLLYSERAHHFRRYKIKGVRHIFMYSLPTNPVFYQEMVRLQHESVADGRIAIEDAHLRAVFSVWDSLKLERVVGTKRQKIMCQGKGDTFDFP